MLILPSLIYILNYVATFQRRNVATTSRKELKISSWVNRHSADQEASESKSVKLHYFSIFMYIYEDFSHFCGIFFLRKSYQTMPLCQNCPICQSAKRAKYYRQTSQIVTNRLFVATVIIGVLVYRVVPSHL